MKRKLMTFILICVAVGTPWNIANAEENEANVIEIDGNEFENEKELWNYLEATYPKVILSDIQSGEYFGSYVIIKTIAKNVELDTASEDTNCDMYYDNGNNSYVMQGSWDVSYDDQSLEKQNFVYGKDYITNMQDNDWLEGCYYVNQDNSIGSMGLAAIRKLGIVNLKDSGKEEKNTHSNYSDDLQSIFAMINTETTIDELEQNINEYNLAYTCEEYKGSHTLQYKLAYNDETARQSHASSGDYLIVTFDTDQENKFMNAQYSKENSSKSALFYNYGTWYDFREDAPGEYSGYYVIDSLSSSNGITIKYDNGNEKKTHYFSCEDVDAAIRKASY